MTNALMASLQPELNAEMPDISPGDTVRVHQRITEGRNERAGVQGVVIAQHGGKSAGARPIRCGAQAHGVGVERTFPLYSKAVGAWSVAQGEGAAGAALPIARAPGQAARLREAFPQDITRAKRCVFCRAEGNRLLGRRPSFGRRFVWAPLFCVGQGGMLLCGYGKIGADS